MSDTPATSSASCACGSAPTLIFACSGAADVGKVADQAARQLGADGVGRMFCLAGIGGRVSGMLASTEAAAALLVIDGCPLACGKRTLENAGFTRFHHVELSQLGMERGKTPCTEAAVAAVVAAARARLAS